MFQDFQIHTDHVTTLCVLNFIVIEQTAIMKLILNTNYESEAPERKILSYKTRQEIDQLFGIVCYAEIHCGLIVECLVYTSDLQFYMKIMFFSERFLRKINCFTNELSTVSEPLSISLMFRSNRKNPEDTNKIRQYN